MRAHQVLINMLRSFIACVRNYLELDNIITIPSWIRFSMSPADIKNNVGLNVTGGDGKLWGRRQYLQSESPLKYFRYKTALPLSILLVRIK